MNWKVLTQEISSAWSLKATTTLVIFLWALNICSSYCPGNFHGNCKCGVEPYGGSDVYVTNCTDANLDNANILEFMAIETVVLIFTGNNVFDLPLNIFGSFGTFDNLRVIDLSNNHIQTIKGKTFHSVSSVKVLILNDNDIYLIQKDNHPRMFSNFENLEELHLRNAFTKKFSSNDEYIKNLEEVFIQSKLNNLRVLNLEKNEISSFPNRDFFCALHSLRELRLSDNRLTEFNVDIKCLPSLKILDLSLNYISYYSSETLTAFKVYPQLKINLTDNPFQCDCNMVDLFQWISQNRTNLVSMDRYNCKDGFPPQNIDRLLSNLSLNDLQCRAFVHDFETDLSAVYAILILIIIAMITLIITVIVYKNKTFVYDVAHRMSINIRRKFQYDSLDKIEETEMEV